MDNKQIQRQILELLNDFNKENPEYYVARYYLIDKLQIDDKKLEKNVLYLYNEKYVDMGKAIGTTFNSVKITSKGIHLIENTVQDSQNVVIASEDANNDITESFYQIYQKIESLNLDNKDEIRQKINIIEEELKKDTISKSKIKDSSDWLKTNANWTILPLAQIIIGIWLNELYK